MTEDTFHAILVGSQRYSMKFPQLSCLVQNSILTLSQFFSSKSHCSLHGRKCSPVQFAENQARLGLVSFHLPEIIKVLLESQCRPSEMSSVPFLRTSLQELRLGRNFVLPCKAPDAATCIHLLSHHTTTERRVPIDMLQIWHIFKDCGS